MRDNGHFLAVGGHCKRACPAGEVAANELAVLLVLGYGDADCLGLPAGLAGVEPAVPGEEQGAVAGDAEVAYRMRGKVGDLLVHGCVRSLCAPYVEDAARLGKVVVGVAVGRPYGIAVLSCESAEFAEGPCGRGELPDVAGDGGGVVLAERILVALVILIQYGAVGLHAHSRNRDGRDLLRASACEADLVELHVAGETVIRGILLDVGDEIYEAVRADGQGRLVAGIGRETQRGAAFRGHHVYVF